MQKQRRMRSVGLWVCRSVCPFSVGVSVRSYRLSVCLSVCLSAYVRNACLYACMHEGLRLYLKYRTPMWSGFFARLLACSTLWRPTCPAERSLGEGVSTKIAAYCRCHESLLCTRWGLMPSPNPRNPASLIARTPYTLNTLAS